jgi:hypothetical protein
MLAVRQPQDETSSEFVVRMRSTVDCCNPLADDSISRNQRKKHRWFCIFDDPV